MSDVKILLKDGSVREFKEDRRPGGSYSQTVVCVPGFVVVCDVWNKKTYVPADSVLEVIEQGR